MERVEIEVRKREEIGKKLKGLRPQGLIPAVVYGKKIKSQPIVVEKKTFIKGVLESGAGRNKIIMLKIAGEKGKDIPVLTQEIQRNPLTDEILHIDFRHIAMDEAIKTKVRIELTGIPLGVKDDGGVLIHGLREVEVKCLPTEIPDKFVIDVAALKIGDALHVSDLAKLAKVEILTASSEMIANCSPPTKEEEVAAAVPTPEEAAAAAAVAPVAGGEAAPVAAAPTTKPAPAGKPEKK